MPHLFQRKREKASTKSASTARTEREQNMHTRAESERQSARATAKVPPAEEEKTK